MDDLIRRSDAIRLIKQWKDNHEDIDAMEEPIEKAEIQGFNLGLATAEREVANIPAVEPYKDAISREYALGVIYPSNTYPSRADIYKALKEAPSVTAEPKHGE